MDDPSYTVRIGPLSTDVSLTPTSYIVLGLLSLAGPSTPYALKQGVAGSVGNFWTVPHSQIYAEPERLARGGYVTEERERGGRRRRVYAITDRGREALEAWRQATDVPLPELRDLGLLKVFFGADPRAIAPGLVERYTERLGVYRQLHAALSASGDPAARGALLTLEAGIAHAELWIGYWSRLAGRDGRTRPRE
jgi:DNA-binding PadR family transcriptional regulator